MFNSIANRLIVIAILLLVLGGFGYLVYDKIYTAGYKEAEDKYVAQLNELSRQIETKKAEVEVLGNVLDSNRLDELKAVNKTLEEYLKEFRRVSRPTTVITKEGKCVPSPEFVEAWNEILRRSK